MKSREPFTITWPLWLAHNGKRNESLKKKTGLRWEVLSMGIGFVRYPHLIQLPNQDSKVFGVKERIYGKMGHTADGDAFVLLDGDSR